MRANDSLEIEARHRRTIHYAAGARTADAVDSSGLLAGRKSPRCGARVMVLAREIGQACKQDGNRLGQADASA